MKRAIAKAPKHQQILRILQTAGGPMTAYEVLDAARKHEISAPPTVYRALNKLIEQGAAHRLETINAYVACVDPQHRHGAAVFAICRDCGNVEELDEADAFRRLRATADKHGFKIETAVIELKGQCNACVGSHA
ncbi:Fur family transcriptional regulator [Bradyrhizobium sp. USDA 3364]